MEQYTELFSVLAGFIGVPLIDMLKKALHVEGRTALLVSGIVSAILAAVALALTGQLTVQSFSLEELASTITLIFASAQVFYRLMAG